MPPQVFNLQRLAVLTASLGASPPDAEVIWEAMRDKVHQPWREGLVRPNFFPPPWSKILMSSLKTFSQIPGLSKILNTMTPSTQPGLLGVCLSGAGPTILALVAKGSHEEATISTDDSEITLGESKPTARMSEIGEAIKSLWKEEGIEVEWMALEVDEDGATLKEIIN